MAIRTYARAARAIGLSVCLLLPVKAAAQDTSTSNGGEHQHADDPAHDRQDAPDHSTMHMEHGDRETMALFPMREGSGTSWLPEASPMYAIHFAAGSWRLMVHANAFVQYLRETSDGRGDDQAGSVNWLMVMARREARGARVGIRAMVSAESATVGGCGYPDLLASGELCDGKPISDRQHPHDLVMELAGEYERPIGRGVRWQLYGGPAGEPALGPVAFPHRISALPNLLAPIGHHWLDATHITYGVATVGLFGTKWKAEASVFNGREPDDRRWDFDFGALDSYSGRVQIAPTAAWAIQVSAGHLREAEAGEIGEPRRDVSRVTASAAYHRLLAESGVWATTIAWGRNDEQGDRPTQFALLETNLTLRDEHAFFGRVEIGNKTAHELNLHDLTGAFTVSRVQVGYTHYLQDRAGLTPGIGALVSAGIVPESLRSTYGSRVNAGFGVFLTLRTAAHAM